MAIAEMTKVMIVSHRTEAAPLLEALQAEGIFQVLDAERAMVSKDWPDLSTEAKRPREIEDLTDRLAKSISFLKAHTKKKRRLIADVLAPRAVVDEKLYAEVVTGQEAIGLLQQSEKTQAQIEELQTECENCYGTLSTLQPWEPLDMPVEQIKGSERVTLLPGLLPLQNFSTVEEKLTDLAATIEQVSLADNKCSCIIVCLNENIAEVQKILRTADFEATNFESMTGTPAELIKTHTDNLSQIDEQLQNQYDEAAASAQHQLKLQILYDHNQNLLNREQTRTTVPATEHTVLLEGWVKKGDYPRLERVVLPFTASSLTKMEPYIGEEIPVDIDNNRIIRPFEVITRLYGMPQRFEVDPTVFLAPFFALFFGLCLTDAGYGLLMVAGSVYFLRKFQGNKRFAGLMVLCSIVTVICGALTGGWFGDAIQVIGVPWLVKARAAVLRFGFDPMQKPMVFFAVALVIGYVQILSGILIAFLHDLYRKDIIAAVCDHLTWLVMLNCLVAYGFSRKGIFIPEEYGRILLRIALVPALIILLLGHRQGSWVGRLGMGVFHLVSTIFYIGDVLSYVRLMALGMVTAGFAAAINQLGLMAGQVKYVGPVLAIIILLGLHSFNMAISALGAFVHTLRLQYVEFFPKFFSGGGRLFEPFAKRYKHIYINKDRF